MQLESIDVKQSARMGYDFLSATQGEKRDRQLLGFGLMFLMMCEGLGENPSEILQVSENIIKKNPSLEHFRAAKQFIKHEMR